MPDQESLDWLTDWVAENQATQPGEPAVNPWADHEPESRAAAPHADVRDPQDAPDRLRREPEPAPDAEEQAPGPGRAESEHGQARHPASERQSGQTTRVSESPPGRG